MFRWSGSLTATTGGAAAGTGVVREVYRWYPRAPTAAIPTNMAGLFKPRLLTGIELRSYFGAVCDRVKL
jgi:hypothetical protein